MQTSPAVRGFITESQFEQAEEEFPGICALYRACEVKPKTFLELVVRYLRAMAAPKSTPKSTRPKAA
jgi:hypothetical protein